MTPPAAHPRRTAVGVLALLAATLAAVLSAALALVLAGPAAATPPPTTRVVVRPVTTDGHVVPGWHVTVDDASISCGEESYAAVDDGIAVCGPGAVNGSACLLAADHRFVYCVTDMYRHQLRRFRLEVPFRRWDPLHKRRTVSPLAVRTTAQQWFEMAHSGGWAELREHPNWVVFYYSTTGRSLRAVYGPTTGDGVNRAHALWTVSIYPHSGLGHAQVRGLATAYYVGYARR